MIKIIIVIIIIIMIIGPWCRLPFPPSWSGARFSPLFCWVVLSTFSSFRWGCFPSLFCWLVLPSFPSSFGWGTFCPPLLLGGAALPPPSLGGAAFFLSFFVVLPSFPSFLECLLLFGGAAFLLLLLWVGLLSPPLLLEGAALPSLSLGGVLGGTTFPFSSVGWCRLASLFGWCCVWPSLLLRGAAFLLLLLGGAAFSLLFSWVVPLGLLRWVLLRFTLSFCVVLPSFSPFWWCCFLTLFCLGAAWPPSLVGDALFPILLCGAAFLHLLLWVGLLSHPLLLEGAALPSLSLGGVLGGATFPFSSVGWCRLASLFGWCCVWPSLLLRDAAFLLLLWVGLLSLSSSLGWCCLASFVGWCCVIPSFFCVVLPSFTTFFGRVSFKKKNQKNRKNEVKNQK